MTLSDQLDIFDDSAAPGVELGARRIGRSLRRLLDSGVVKVDTAPESPFRIVVTEEGRRFLAGLRAARGIGI